MGVGTTTEAIQYIARRLGQRTDLNDAIYNEMLIAQSELERMPVLPWFLVTQEFTYLLANFQRVPLPIRFLREYEDGALWKVENCCYTKLIKTHLDVLNEIMCDTSGEDNPRYYQLAGNAFHIGPPSTTDTMLMMMFYKGAETLVEGGSANSWLEYAPEALMSRTGMRMAQYLASTELYAMFSAQHADAMRLLEVEDTSRYTQNFETSLCMGGT